MGKFIWHQWAQFVNIFASVCAYLSLSLQPELVRCCAVLTPFGPACPPLPAVVIWAGIWGCLFPKFFWDFVRGTLLTSDIAKSINYTCTDDTPCGIV